jgi:hypothetical protein
MWPSAMIALSNINKAINGGFDSDHIWHPGVPLGTKIIVSGYSQGALAVDWWWLTECLTPGGACHNRYQNGDIVRIYNFGDVLRSPGISYGNTLLWGQPVPPNHDGQVTGGIGGPLDLTEAQTNIPSSFDGKPVVMSFNNPGDLYGAAPCGSNPWHSQPAVESIEYLFFKIVMYEKATDYLKLSELILHPIGDIEAAINAGTFFAAGFASPHFQYFDAMVSAITDALNIGNALPHEGC